MADVQVVFSVEGSRETAEEVVADLLRPVPLPWVFTKPSRRRAAPATVTLESPDVCLDCGDTVARCVCGGVTSDKEMEE